MKINDRVEFIAGELKGSQGVIRTAIKGFIGIELDEEIEGGNNLNGLCPEKKGYWTKESQISKFTRFKIGQSVYVVEDNDILYGLKGTVICVQDEGSESDPSYGIEFDFESSMFHNLSGKCEPYRGYWIREGWLIEEEEYIKPIYSKGDKILLRPYNDLIAEYGIENGYINTSVKISHSTLSQFTVGKVYEVLSARLAFIKISSNDEVINIPNEAVYLLPDGYSEPYYCSYSHSNKGVIDSAVNIKNRELGIILSKFAEISYFQDDYAKLYEVAKSLNDSGIATRNGYVENSIEISIDRILSSKSIKHRGFYVYCTNEMYSKGKELLSGKEEILSDASETLFWNKQGLFILLINSSDMNQIVQAFETYFKALGVNQSIIDAMYDPVALETIIESYISEYEKVANKIQKQEAAEKIRAVMHERCINRIKSDIDNKLVTIQQYEDAIRERYKELRDLRIRKLGLESASEEENDLLVFLKSCRTISNIKVVDDSVTFTTVQPCVMYERKEFELSRFRSNTDYQRVSPWKFDLLEDIFLNNKYTLYFEDCVMVDLNYYNVGIRKDDYRPSFYMEGIPNPHHYYYNCWGEHATYFNESLSRGDVVQLFNQIIAAVSGINFADSSVVSKFIKTELDNYYTVKCLVNNDTKVRLSIRDYKELWEKSHE